jgi:hypothetical protein
MSDEDELNGIRNVHGLTIEDLLEEIVCALNDLQDVVERMESKIDAMTAE